MAQDANIQRRQQDQYSYPYHHIPFIDERGEGRRIRVLKWGFEYLLYMDRLMDEIRALRPSSVLDVGCGDGYLLGHLGEEVGLRVGVDINERALSFAKAFFPAVEYRNCDVADVSESFDVVSAVEVLEHIPDEGVRAFLQAIFARVKLDGSLFISVPTTNEPLNSKHFRHYDLPLLKEQIADAELNLSVVRSNFYYKRTFIERLYQRITSSLFVQGEIPLFRWIVWRYVRRCASSANSSDGLHLIVHFKRDL
jgi:2-polyprenyl-3-methyl-5-hydroxy-6-metoxy-1,4-benzoquinol methylase